MRLVFAIFNWVLDLSILRVQEVEEDEDEGDASPITPLGFGVPAVGTFEETEWDEEEY